jgi:superfamily II DNA or RNA helicase
MIQLRDYQKQMIGGLYSSIRSGKKRILLIALMGLGKTVISSWIMRDATTREKRCLFLVPLTVLIDQTIETLEALGVHCSALQGDRNYDPTALVTVASLQTIASRIRSGQSLQDIIGEKHLLFADESHVTAFDTVYPELENFVLGNGGFCIGMTATPWRLSKKQWLGQKYDHAIEGPQPPEAIKLGAVVPCRGFRIGGVFDLEKLKVSNGDYTLDSIAEQATKPEALSFVVSEWKRLAFGRPTMMVGATVEQARQTAQVFESKGIKTALIIGETPHQERLAIFEQVNSGEVQIICSVGCLTAGFNLPAISAIVYVRATKSKALFFQTAGRGSRPAPDKTDFLLLDFGGNLKRFGNPMGHQNYDISEPKKQGAEHDPYKECPDCHAEVLNFAKFCPHCGYEFGGGDEEDDISEAFENGLTEFVDKTTKEQIANIRRWRKEAYRVGASPDRAISKFYDRYRQNPPSAWLRHACLRKNASHKSKQKFLDYLDNSYNGQPQWAQTWLEYHLMLEFGTSDFSQIFQRDWRAVLGVPYAANWEQVKRSYIAKIKALTEADYDLAEELNAALEDAEDDRAVSVA